MDVLSDGIGRALEVCYLFRREACPPNLFGLVIRGCCLAWGLDSTRCCLHHCLRRYPILGFEALAEVEWVVEAYGVGYLCHVEFALSDEFDGTL